MVDLNNVLCFSPNKNQLACPSSTTCSGSDSVCQAMQNVADCKSNTDCLNMLKAFAIIDEEDACVGDIISYALNGTAPNNFAQCKQVCCQIPTVCFDINYDNTACPSSLYTCSTGLEEGGPCNVINAIAACNTHANPKSCIGLLQYQYSDPCSLDLISYALGQGSLYGFQECAPVCCT